MYRDASLEWQVLVRIARKVKWNKLGLRVHNISRWLGRRAEPSHSGSPPSLIALYNGHPLLVLLLRYFVVLDTQRRESRHNHEERTRLTR
jgi:hypothetical protein